MRELDLEFEACACLAPELFREWELLPADEVDDVKEWPRRMTMPLDLPFGLFPFALELLSSTAFPEGESVEASQSRPNS